MSRSRTRFALVVGVAIGLFVVPASTPLLAHEDEETHARLSVGALLFLDQAAPQDGALFDITARWLIRQGSIDEDVSARTVHRGPES